MNRRLFQVSLSSLLLLIVVVSLGFALWPQYSAWRAVSEVSNADIEYRYTPFGIFIDLHGNGVEAVEQLGGVANPWLFDALADQDKFVAADMLLSKINIDQYSAGRKNWNGYDFSKADKETKADLQQLPKSVKYWKKELNR